MIGEDSGHQAARAWRAGFNWTLAGALVICAASFWYIYARMPLGDAARLELTRARMAELASAMERYRSMFSTLPGVSSEEIIASLLAAPTSDAKPPARDLLASLSAEKARIGRFILDGWGHPMRVSVAGGKVFVIQSSGADGIWGHRRADDVQYHSVDGFGDNIILDENPPEAQATDE